MLDNGTYLLFGRKARSAQLSDKANGKRTTKRVLGTLVEDSKAVDNLNTPELEILVAAKKVLASGYALHVAVEDPTHALTWLGRVTLREAVDFFLSHHRADLPRLMPDENASKTQERLQAKGVLEIEVPCLTEATRNKLQMSNLTVGKGCTSPKAHLLDWSRCKTFDAEMDAQFEIFDSLGV